MVERIGFLLLGDTIEIQSSSLLMYSNEHGDRAAVRVQGRFPFFFWLAFPSFLPSFLPFLRFLLSQTY